MSAMLDSFIICDVEATDKFVNNAQLLTGCFLHCDKDLNILDTFVFESRPRSWDKHATDAVAIHGITWEMAKTFKPWMFVAKDISEWLRSKPTSHFVCHANRSIFGKFYTYDYAVLKYQLFDFDLHWDLYKTCPEKYILSTHSLAKHVDHLFGFGGKFNLKAISDRFELGEFAHHDAVADTKRCLEILKRILPRVNIEEFLNKEFFKTMGDENESETTRKKNPRRSKKLS
jgi:DNA polymerase III epsilon subunit-like protein